MNSPSHAGRPLPAGRPGINWGKPVLWGLVLAVATALGSVALRLHNEGQLPGLQPQLGSSAYGQDGVPAGTVRSDEASYVTDSGVQSTSGGERVSKREPNNLYYGKIQAPICMGDYDGIVGESQYIEVPVDAELILKFGSEEEVNSLTVDGFEDWSSCWYAPLQPPTSEYSLSIGMTYVKKERPMPIVVKGRSGTEVRFTCPGAVGPTLIKTSFHGGLGPRERDYPKHYRVDFVQR